MTARFNEAFILAAGHGSRMRPFTDHTPKPMAEIGGQTMIERIMDQCMAASVDHLFINTHHLAEKLEDHIGKRAHILHETELLNTGLGIKKALPHMSGQPFYTISGDSWWRDGTSSVFKQMDAGWNDSLDLLLVLQRIDTMHVTEGVGDYRIVDGKPQRAKDQSGTHIFTSIRLCHPRLFDGSPDIPFSFLELMDKAENEGRLGAIELDGVWQHLTSMDDVTAVNAWLAQ